MFSISSTKNLNYTESTFDSFIGFICCALDVFVSPVIFYQVWNHILPEMFHIPTISYIQALFVKLVIEFYIQAAFSYSYRFIIYRKEKDYYINALYDKIVSLENTITQMHKPPQSTFRDVRFIGINPDINNMV